MKACYGSGNLNSLVIHLGSRWREVVDLFPSQFTPAEKVPTWNERRLLGPKVLSGRFGEKNKSHTVA